MAKRLCHLTRLQTGCAPSGVVAFNRLAALFHATSLRELAHAMERQRHDVAESWLGFRGLAMRIRPRAVYLSLLAEHREHTRGTVVGVVLCIRHCSHICICNDEV